MTEDSIKFIASSRGECTDTLRRRITELEAEGKKLTMDIKLKEEQIRDLEIKVQVNSLHGVVLLVCFVPIGHF